MSSFQTQFFVCLLGHFLSRDSTFALLLNDNKACEESSTLPVYGILVTHSRPNNSDRGSVLIKTAINHTEVFVDPMCTWTYRIQDHKSAVVIKYGALNDGSSLRWIFSMTGLLRVSVTAQFEKEGIQGTIKNCTYVNVTDCHLVPKLKVSTSTGSYNITKNHTVVTMDGPPGMVNFTASTLLVDPYFLCRHLYFSWNFSDGRNASGEHVGHYYNRTGIYYVVLKMYKVFDEKKHFFTNITVKMDIKGSPAGSKSMDAVIDVSLVLAIFFVCFVFVVCVATYWFRRRRHRHTEVARFDFRASEFQSSSDERSSLIKSSRKGCIGMPTCRRKSNEYLSNNEENDYERYSTYERFDDRNLYEEL